MPYMPQMPRFKKQQLHIYHPSYCWSGISKHRAPGCITHMGPPMHKDVCLKCRCSIVIRASWKHPSFAQKKVNESGLTPLPVSLSNHSLVCISILACVLPLAAAIELAPGENTGLLIKQRQNNYQYPIINGHGQTINLLWLLQRNTSGGKWLLTN